jgi:hypothetical protein
MALGDNILNFNEDAPCETSDAAPAPQPLIKFVSLGISQQRECAYPRGLVHGTADIEPGMVSADVARLGHDSNPRK